MRHVWQQLPLHMKIFLSFGLLLALSMVAVSVYASFIVTQELDQQMMTGVERTMLSSGQKVASELTLFSQQTRLLANNHSLQQALSGYEEQPMVEKWERWRRILSIGETWYQSRNALEIRLHLGQNMVFLRDNIWLIPNEDVPRRLAAEQGNADPLWSVTADGRGISCFVPLRSGWDHLGYVELMLQASHLSGAIDTLSDTGLSVYLLHAGGQPLLANTSQSFPHDLTLPDPLPTDTAHPAYLRFQRDGEPMLRAVLPLQDVPFYLVGEMPSALISQAGLTMLRSIMLVGLLVLLPAFLVAFFISQSITRRLRTLSGAMGRLEAGDLDVQIAQPGLDELGQMLGRFDRMASALKMSHETNEIMQKAKRESELRLLQAQINPHFIHNTLESIAWAAKQQDADKVDYLVRNLSGFLRLSLVKTEQMGTLARELQLVQFYFNVQSYRFNGRVSLELDIQPEALDTQMLPLLIQPLVENALLHGILKAPEGHGTITLRAQVLDDLLLVEVQDDGLGMDEATLETLRAHLNDPREGSYGLWNVHQRVRSYAGEDYGLSIESSPRNGTLCLLAMPVSASK